MSPLERQPRLLCESQQRWAEWLEVNHGASTGVWLQFAKKKSGVVTVNYAEALDVALRYGWIDGQAASLDEAYYLQRFTPRGPRSVWSKVNRAAATALIERGEMKSAGLAAVERARQNGQWDRAYDPPSRASVPDDLQTALDASPRASTFFTSLNSQNRYAILHRLQSAATPETRARRIAQFVEMLERGEKPYP